MRRAILNTGLVRKEGRVSPIYRWAHESFEDFFAAEFFVRFSDLSITLQKPSGMFYSFLPWLLNRYHDAKVTETLFRMLADKLLNLETYFSASDYTKDGKLLQIIMEKKRSRERICELSTISNENQRRWSRTYPFELVGTEMHQKDFVQKVCDNMDVEMVQVFDTKDVSLALLHLSELKDSQISSAFLLELVSRATSKDATRILQRYSGRFSSDQTVDIVEHYGASPEVCIADFVLRGDDKTVRRLLQVCGKESLVSSARDAVVKAAAEGGRENIVDMFIGEGGSISRAAAGAAKSGRESLLVRLLGDGDGVDRLEAIVEAITSGQTELAAKIFTEKHFAIVAPIASATGSDVDKLITLLVGRVDIDELLCIAMRWCVDPKNVEVLFENGANITAAVCQAAAENFRSPSKAICFLLEKGARWDLFSDIKLNLRSKEEAKVVVDVLCRFFPNVNYVVQACARMQGQFQATVLKALLKKDGIRADLIPSLASEFVKNSDTFSILLDYIDIDILEHYTSEFVSSNSLLLLDEYDADPDQVLRSWFWGDYEEDSSLYFEDSGRMLASVLQFGANLSKVADVTLDCESAVTQPEAQYFLREHNLSLLAKNAVGHCGCSTNEFLTIKCKARSCVKGQIKRLERVLERDKFEPDEESRCAQLLAPLIRSFPDKSLLLRECVLHAKNMILVEQVLMAEADPNSCVHLVTDPVFEPSFRMVRIFLKSDLGLDLSLFLRHAVWFGNVKVAILLMRKGDILLPLRV